MSLPYEFKAETIIEQGRTSYTAVKGIKNWLKTTNIPDLQKETIVLFLTSCENDIAMTRNTIRAYFRLRSGAPDNMCKDRDIDSKSLDKASKTETICCLPARINNTVIIFGKLIDTNYRNFVLSDCIKLSSMIIDASQRYNPPDDMIVILDTQGVTFMHLTRMKLNILKTTIDYMQEGMPLKIKKFHLLNVNYIADKILALAKLFMKSELAAAIQVHSPGLSMDEFHAKWMPASCLPKEYGGDLPSYHELNDRAISELREMKRFFEAEEQLISSYNSCG